MSTTAAVPSAIDRCDRATRVTKSLLGYGVLAGPFYVLVVVLQALVRPGFDLAHDDASLLSNGRLGWVQVTNFVVTGLIVVAFAAGVGRALSPGRSAAWARRLLSLYGSGLIAAGIFVADPMNGFPIGAPAGHPAAVSVHGMVHILAAGIGFLALVAACFVVASRLAREGAVRLAVMSRLTGALFLVASFAVASGSSSTLVVSSFWIALLLAWSWMAAVAVHLYRRAGSGRSAPAAGASELIA